VSDAEGTADSPTLSIQQSGTAPDATTNTESETTELAEVDGTMETPLDSELPEGGRTFAGKYESIEALERGYQELEQKLGSQASEMSQLDIEGILQRAGLENESIIQNWQADSKLTDEQYGSLAKIGIGKSLVDSFLAGQQAIAFRSDDATIAIKNEAAQMAGGEIELQNLLAWAGQNYPEGSVDDLNRRLDDSVQYKSALKEILYDYRQATATGFTKPLVTGERMPNTSSGYATVSELLTAIRQAKTEGHMSEATKRRLANTKPHIIQGIDDQGG